MQRTSKQSKIQHHFEEIEKHQIPKTFNLQPQNKTRTKFLEINPILVSSPHLNWTSSLISLKE
jgi:hypothetical protein